MAAATKTAKLNQQLKNCRSNDGMITKGSSAMVTRESSVRLIQPHVRQLIKLSNHGKTRTKAPSKQTTST
jgi:hypothetical protein